MKQQTRELLARVEAVTGDPHDKLVAVFEQHYRLAAREMKPEAALATAYSAAQNWLASKAQRDAANNPSRPRRGVKGE